MSIKIHSQWRLISGSSNREPIQFHSRACIRMMPPYKVKFASKYSLVKPPSSALSTSCFLRNPTYMVMSAPGGDKRIKYLPDQRTEPFRGRIVKLNGHELDPEHHGEDLHGNSHNFLHDDIPPVSRTNCGVPASHTRNHYGFGKLATTVLDFRGQESALSAFTVLRSWLDAGQRRTREGGE